MKVLITGSEGFVGRNLIPFLQERQIDCLGLDKDAPFPSRPETTRYRLGSFSDDAERIAKNLEDIDGIVHLASESHVDRSITGPKEFVDNNVGGTLELFEIARALQSHKASSGLNPLQSILLFSTDEVGACLAEGSFYETNNFHCGSVYSASKGAQELLAQAYIKTYSLPIITSRCVNIFGPHQWDEKFIPTICRSAIEGKPIPIYGSGMQQRQWVPVDHVCEFINFIVASTFIPPGTILHCTGTREIYNISLARTILNILGASGDLIEHVKDRLGHDQRYSLGRGDATEHFGTPEYDTTKFDRDLIKTVEHYRERYAK